MFYERQHVARIGCNNDDHITVERNIYGAWCIYAMTDDGLCSEEQYYYYTLRFAVEHYAELNDLRLPNSWADGIDGDLLDGCDDCDEEEGDSGYDYIFEHGGLTIATPSGSCFLQGDDASELYDLLEANPLDIVRILSEYEHICE